MNTAALFKAKQDLNKFLEEHPELRDVQAMIEEALRGAGSQENRMALISSYMMRSVSELNNALQGLKSGL